MTLYMTREEAIALLAFLQKDDTPNKNIRVIIENLKVLLKSTALAAPQKAAKAV